MRNPNFRGRRARRLPLGMSIVEVMIALTLGMIILAGLASIFASSSAARTEMERSARQIENGRFAMELLGDDLRLAGFYGELNLWGMNPPAALPDPCSVDPAVWNQALPIGVQAFDRAAGAPACLPGDVKAGTDVLVVRFANTCEAGSPNCEALTGNLPYVQVSKCSSTTPPENLVTPYLLGLQGSVNFTLRNRDCINRAGLRRYFVRIYYVSDNNGKGEPIPTLKRLDLRGTVWEQTPLVEGIEELNIEYGIDSNRDGNPEAYTANPTTFLGCSTPPCDAVNNWFNVVTANISLLARNTESSVGYTDSKIYTLGRDDAGNLINVNPGGPYRRHAYTGAVRLVNVGQRREKP